MKRKVSDVVSKRMQGLKMPVAKRSRLSDEERMTLHRRIERDRMKSNWKYKEGSMGVTRRYLEELEDARSNPNPPKKKSSYIVVEGDKVYNEDNPGFKFDEVEDLLAFDALREMAADDEIVAVQDPPPVTTVISEVGSGTNATSMAMAVEKRGWLPKAEWVKTLSKDELEAHILKKRKRKRQRRKYKKQYRRKYGISKGGGAGLRGQSIVYPNIVGHGPYSLSGT